MALPAPNLDDRRFQQFVDDAKRYVQQRCPEWTDHNVSDPGVTLIETVAYMVDQLVYRLNRVPDKNYLAFLDLLGVTLFPPGAARAPITFWLSAAQQQTVTVPGGTEIATERPDAEQATVFTTLADLAIVSCELIAVLSRPARSRCGWTAGWTASASTRGSPRWSGRPGRRTAGRSAKWSGTPPVRST